MFSQVTVLQSSRIFSHSVLPLPLQTIPQMISLSLPHHFCLPVQVVYCYDYVYDAVCKFCRTHFDCVNMWCWPLLMMYHYRNYNLLPIPCTFECTVCSLNKVKPRFVNITSHALIMQSGPLRCCQTSWSRCMRMPPCCAFEHVSITTSRTWNMLWVFAS